MEKKRGKFYLNFRTILFLFAIVPLICGSLISNAFLVTNAGNKLSDTTNGAMLSLNKEIGIAFDYFITNGEDTVKGFAKAPIVSEYLKNPEDEELAAKAQEYTVEYFNSLEGWEGIYIADWNSKVLTHPVEAVVGRVMREGDRLAELQNAMLGAENDIFNVGIIASPASGKLIVSMYAPVYDDNGTPVGYVGAGTYIKDTADTLTDVTSLNFDSAYAYLVNSSGDIIYHPDEERIGTPVENDVIQNVLSELNKDKAGSAELVSYTYNETEKIASYYVGYDADYIVILVADKSEVTSSSRYMVMNAMVLTTAICVIFIFVSFYISKLITKPFTRITETVGQVAEGNLDVDTDIHTILKETDSLVQSSVSLKTKLKAIMGEVKSISDTLSEGAANVNQRAVASTESVNQVSNIAKDIAEGALSMASSVDLIDEQTVNMGNSIDELTANTNILVDLSNEIKAANNDASEYINKVSASSVQSVNAVNDITRQISDTNSAILSVQEAVNMIKSIASKTNLLALNASIEAARAGEAGRGFSVVATEIGSLSTQSNNSAGQISDIVRNIIDQSEKSVKLSTDVVELIKKEQGYILDTQQKFDDLNEKIESSLKEIMLIAGKLESLDSAKSNIISSIADLGAISEENAASTAEVSSSINSVVADIESISSNSEETRNIAETLTEAVQYFKF